MPKYLCRCSYVGEGVKGLLKDGGSKRREVVAQLIKGMGGTLEAFYYAFGEDDLILIVDSPDNITTASVNLTVVASGQITVKTTVLLTPEEIDQAVRKSPVYSPPGQ